jgi:hypothetical protein
MHIPDELTGSWKGVATYGTSYPAAIAGKILPFNIKISEQTGETFSGECTDLDEPGKRAGVSVIKGTVNSSSIQFTKQYAVRRLINRQGLSFIQPGKPGLIVYYTGQWNEEQRCFKGEWELVMPKGLLYKLFTKQAQKGTWQMGREEEPVIPPENELIIKMHYRKEDVEAAYYSNGQGRVMGLPGMRYLIYIMLATLGSCVLFYLLAFAFESPGFIALSLFSVFVLIWLGGPLIKHLRMYSKWKSEVKVFTRRLVADKYHILTLNRRTLSIDKPDEILIERWENIKDVRILKDYIILSGNEPKHLFLAASMQQEEYELLKKYLLTYIKG